MKSLSLILLLAGAASVLGHDHIEAGLDPADPGRLKLDGPASQVAPLVPKGEFFSAYLPEFPGGYFANELTFSVEGFVLDVPVNSEIEIRVESISGPLGSEMSFWLGASEPQRVLPNGWVASEADEFAFVISEFPNGEGHVHGRAFAMSREGMYSLVVRAVDRSGIYLPSAPFTITFEAVLPPALSVVVSDGDVELGFIGRAGMSYDVQRSTTLADGSWELLDILSAEVEIPLGYSELATGEPRVFFRLVEY